MFLDYFALVMLVFVTVVIFYGVIAIHDIPYEIAKKRNHPHQDAIHYAAGLAYLPCMYFGHSYGYGPHYGVMTAVGASTRFKRNKKT